MPSDTENNLTGKKILIVHFRVGKTDGVSIEIAAWKEILEKAGAIVKLCSGPVNEGADYVISNLEQQLNPTIFNLDEAAFGKSFLTKDQIIQEIKNQQKIISEEFDKILSDFHPDRIIISNIFSVGEHIAAAGAFVAVLDKWHTKTLAVHHDFWWENIRYKKPTFHLIKNQLEEYFPPLRPWLNHTVINSIAQDSLQKRKGLRASIIYDTVNFEKPFNKITKHNNLFDVCCSEDSDIFILQATRIVRRKNIEIAIDLVKTLSSPPFVDELAQKPLYNSKTFSPANNKINLILAGYTEKRDEQYKSKLLKYGQDQGVSICYLGDLINAPGTVYTLWDAYPKADLITYPSEYEGFGNQFLEGVYAKKPVAVFEYPVFKTDIAPKGFQFISLGDSTTKDENDLNHIPRETLHQAAEEIVELLTDTKAYSKMVETNFRLGGQNFSYQNTLSVLNKLLA